MCMARLTANSKRKKERSMAFRKGSGRIFNKYFSER